MPNHSTAICILGMHRSGTSAITRAVNLLGVYLGERGDLGEAGPDNPEGFWERRDIIDLQARLLVRLHRTWDSAAPLPEQWHTSDKVLPFKEELKRLVAANFASHSIWAWKDPRTCLLLPLWKEALAGTNLRCLFVVRSPLDVANSLNKRDPIALGKAFGVWFNHYLTALKDAAGLSSAFLSYDNFLASWEPELRRCAASLGIGWPQDERRLRDEMSSFIRPNLRHSHSTLDGLRGVPHPVRELYELLLEVSAQPAVPEARLRETVDRLFRDFYGYASFFQGGLDSPALGQSNLSNAEDGLTPLRPPLLKRTLQRWKKSFRKRVGRPKSRSRSPGPAPLADQDSEHSAQSRSRGQARKNPQSRRGD